MKILKETTDPQTLRIIPRSYVDTVDVILTNERTNTPVTLSGLTATTNGGYLDITNVFDLKEDNNYSFEVKDVLSKTIYKGKIFCTNQDDYTINNGLYTERGKDNKYVIYE